jgi:uncharacterized protein DUF1566
MAAAQSEKTHIVVFALRIAFLGTLAGSTIFALGEDKKEIEKRARERVEVGSIPPGMLLGDKTARDTTTGLEWMRETAPERLRWEEAKSYCPTVTADGGGFRLPSRDELLTLLKYHFDPFSEQVDWYWSSTIGVRAGTAWAVGCGSWLNGNPVDTRSRVRCVREAPR